MPLPHKPEWSSDYKSINNGQPICRSQRNNLKNNNNNKPPKNQKTNQNKKPQNKTKKPNQQQQKKVNREKQGSDWKRQFREEFFCRTKCCYICILNNENTSHLWLFLLILTPAAARLGHQCNIWGNVQLWCIYFYTVRIKVLTHSRIVTLTEISATCFLFSLESQSRAVEGQQIPVLPAN